MPATTSLVKKRKERGILDYAYPGSVQAKLRARHPSLSDEAWAKVEHALREWLVVCLHRRRSEVGMPSRIVDEAWHEFILDTRAYTSFCNRVFGAYLHHAPDSELETAMPTALANSVRAWDRSALARSQGEATLWQLDHSLGIPDPLGIDFLTLQEIRSRPKPADGGFDSGGAPLVVGRDHDSSREGGIGSGGASCAGGGGCGGGGGGN